MTKQQSVFIDLDEVTATYESDLVDKLRNFGVGGELFETATLTLRPGAKYVRFEIVDAQGYKAWSNPYDLANL